MADRMPEDLQNKISENILKYMLENLPHRIPDRMSENIPTKIR